MDKGLWINSQPIVYQDNADASKYKVEVHKGQFNTKIATNSLTSIGANDDIVMDANGTGKIKFNTITNGVQYSVVKVHQLGQLKQQTVMQLIQ